MIEQKRMAPELPQMDPVAFSRVVVTETIYHQQPEDSPTSIEHQSSYFLESNEQSYVRKIVVKKEWQPIECGWVDHPSIIHLSNEEGKRLLVIPTEQQKKETDSKQVEVGVSLPVGPGNRQTGSELIQPFALLKPGQPALRLNPFEIKNLRVRCLNGPCRSNLSLFPS